MSITLPENFFSALHWITSLLEKHQVKYQITGGLAAHIYGAKRALNDIDIDLAKNDLDRLVPALQNYIIEGPLYHEDSTFKSYLVVLKYQGQLIDLAAVDNAFIFNKNTKIWDAMHIDLETRQFFKVENIELPVQEPQALISYKSKIGYDEQKHLSDVAAIQEFR